MKAQISNQSKFLQGGMIQNQSSPQLPQPYGLQQSPKLQQTQYQQLLYQQSQYQPLQAQSMQSSVLRCPNHQGEAFKRICTSVGCLKNVILCAECCFEDPDHIKLHKDFMMPINDYLQMIDNQHRSRAATSRMSVRGQQDLPPQISDLAQHDEQYMQTLSNSLNGERRKMNNDFSAIDQIIIGTFDQSKFQVQGELDQHYAHINQSLVDFKQAINPSVQQQDNPKLQFEQAMKYQGDMNLVQQQLRTIRDKSSNESLNGSVLEGAGNIYKCGSLADAIKKSIAHPPQYTSVQQGILSEFAEKLKIIFNELSLKMIQNISTPPIDEEVSSPDIFSNFAISQDGLSAKLSIKENLVLSHSPTVLSTFHKERINCIKALDVPYLVTGSMDGLAMMWNLDNGELVTTFQGHKGPITCLGTFKSKKLETNHVENYLVSGSTDTNVILWDLDDESNTFVFKGHENTVTTIMSLEDEQHIATGGADRKIIVWDIINGKISCILPCNGSIYKLHKLKTGGNKSFFLSCDHSQALNIFKVEYSLINTSKLAIQKSKSITISLEKVILTPCLIYGITSSLSNPLVMVGSGSDKTVKVWNFNYNKEDGKFSNEKIVKEFQGHKGGVTDTIIIDTQNSTPNNEDYYIITCSLNDERIIVKHSRSQQTQFYVHHGLMINEPFTSHKMQVTRNSRNEYKLVVVNQSPGNHEVLFWDLNDSRIL